MQRVRRQIQAEEIDYNKHKENAANIAVLDTGCFIHPDLKDNILCFQDFVHQRIEAYDDNGHGTHIAGILCGSGKLSNGSYRGMSPNSKLLIGKVLDHKGDGTASVMKKGILWVLANREKYKIRILNISVGLGDNANVEHLKEVCELLEIAYESGILVVCSAGNNGPLPGSLSKLGVNERIITVGCHDGVFFQKSKKRCELYSGRGDSSKGIMKPDIVAPGTEIVSCNYLTKNYHGKYFNPYIPKSGTSMATPIVSGALLLCIQYYPNMKKEELREKLFLSTDDLGESRIKQGYGMVNIKKLLS